MFGLSEFEMEKYKDTVQNFAVLEVAPFIVESFPHAVPVARQGDKLNPDMDVLHSIVQDIELITILTSLSIAHDYAHYQHEDELDEKEIVDKLHKKYEDYIFMQAVKYGLVFPFQAIDKLIAHVVVELPYLYTKSITDTNFDEDLFLEERLAAYDDYVDKYMIAPEMEEEEDYDEDDE
jgi:hypothetical protein